MAGLLDYLSFEDLLNLSERQQGNIWRATDPAKLPADYVGPYRDQPAGLEFKNRISVNNIPGVRPYTLLGTHSLLEAVDTAMPIVSPNTAAVTSGRLDDSSRTKLIRYNPIDPDPNITRAHEVEHVLSQQNLGEPGSMSKKWNEIAPTSSAQVMQRMIANAPYLQEKFGLPTNEFYFDPEFMKDPNYQNMIDEQFATLSALEQLKNKRLTDDPYVRENILTTPEDRAAYNAMTGLRQTRLDPRDIAPYTPVSDKFDVPIQTEDMRRYSRPRGLLYR
jgi:hypothetical protein